MGPGDQHASIACLVPGATGDEASRTEAEATLTSAPTAQRCEEGSALKLEHSELQVAIEGQIKELHDFASSIEQSVGLDVDEGDAFEGVTWVRHARAIPCRHCGRLFFRRSLPFHDERCKARMASEIVTCSKCGRELCRGDLDDHASRCGGSAGPDAPKRGHASPCGGSAGPEGPKCSQERRRADPDGNAVQSDSSAASGAPRRGRGLRDADIDDASRCVSSAGFEWRAPPRRTAAAAEVRPGCFRPALATRPVVDRLRGRRPPRPNSSSFPATQGAPPRRKHPRSASSIQLLSATCSGSCLDSNSSAELPDSLHRPSVPRVIVTRRRR
mmetsp:Transcript_118662/g.335618  ORF Transcript_118662/g.335618 Transcript_118662/m.335618 type:complete len:329 (+) Transcript_118662:102-1088(+)